MPHLARPAARALALGLLALGVMGMGALGGSPQGGSPARDFRATFIDVDGTRMEVDRVTAGGDISLDGELGRGRLRVPFDNIARITMQPAEERDRVRARVELREGEPITLALRSSTTFYGHTPAGAFQIRARDLKAVEFTQ
jgi:hypothetical protein